MTFCTFDDTVHHTNLSEAFFLDCHNQAFVYSLNFLNPANIDQLFRGQSESFVVAAAATVFLTLYCYFGSVLTQDYSFVDRIWSLSPALFAWIFYLHGGMHLRCLIMASLITMWAARLTYNFARKGGYKLGHEDYRWPYLRENYLSPTAFQIFNATFIAPYQNWLLLSLTFPVFFASKSTQPELNAADLVATMAFFISFALEIAADQQQWDFHQEKHSTAKRRRKGDLKRGFLTNGLFRYSRHPNFFAEQCIWWSIYLFTIAAGYPPMNASCIGAALLTFLFQGSTWLTEHISASKYPEYEDYQETTSRLMPWFPGRSLDASD